MSTIKKIVVFISGNGSNLQTFIDKYQAPDCAAQLVLVLSNRPDAYGLQRARQAGIPTAVVDHRQFEQRDDFDRALLDTLAPYQPDVVVLAGFMRILGTTFVSQYKGRLFNIHPSLLPKYPGLNTHQRAIDAGDKYAGVTVHFVSEELDGGPAVIQAKIEIEENDTEQTLAQRVLVKEHLIYPLAIEWFLNGQLILKDNHAYLDRQQLPPSGKPYC